MGGGPNSTSLELLRLSLSAQLSPSQKRKIPIRSREPQVPDTRRATPCLQAPEDGRDVVTAPKDC